MLSIVTLIWATNWIHLKVCSLNRSYTSVESFTNNTEVSLNRETFCVNQFIFINKLSTLLYILSLFSSFSVEYQWVTLLAFVAPWTRSTKWWYFEKLLSFGWPRKKIDVYKSDNHYLQISKKKKKNSRAHHHLKTQFQEHHSIPYQQNAKIPFPSVHYPFALKKVIFKYFFTLKTTFLLTTVHNDGKWFVKTFPLKVNSAPPKGGTRARVPLPLAAPLILMNSIKDIRFFTFLWRALIWAQSVTSGGMKGPSACNTKKVFCFVLFCFVYNNLEVYTPTITGDLSPWHKGWNNNLLEPSGGTFSL